MFFLSNIVRRGWMQATPSPVIAKGHILFCVYATSCIVHRRIKYCVTNASSSEKNVGRTNISAGPIICRFIMMFKIAAATIEGRGQVMFIQTNAIRAPKVNSQHWSPDSLKASIDGQCHCNGQSAYSSSLPLLLHRIMQKKNELWLSCNMQWESARGLSKFRPRTASQKVCTQVASAY